MFVSDLALDWFRSYRNLVLALEPGVSVFWGQNGHGKTNLLEALYYLSVLSSHRVSATLMLPTQNPECENRVAVIRARVRYESETGKERSDLLELEVLPGHANRAMINRNRARPRDLLGHLSTVMFAPEDLALINGDPSMRRGFLDTVNLQLRPAYAAVLSEYAKVARQRGAYLKDVAKRRATIDEAQLSVWDEALIPPACKIMLARRRLLDDLGEYLPQIYGQISSETPTLQLGYASSVSKTLELDLSQAEEMFSHPEELSENMRAALLRRRSDEARRGVNLVGPHRDEVEVMLHELPVKGYASHGETWSVALALRLAQFYLLKDRLGDVPVLLLDDVFSELDGARRAALLGAIKVADQVLITAAMGSELPEELDARFYDVLMDESRFSHVSKREVAS